MLGVHIKAVRKSDVTSLVNSVPEMSGEGGTNIYGGIRGAFYSCNKILSIKGK